MTETELVFTEILNCSRLSLYLDRERCLEKNKSFLIAAALKRRFAGEPIQYILGKTEFMGLEFRLTPDVFIPRPETEILVETAVRYASCVMRYASCVNILDLGTGSGCIAVSLAKFLLSARIYAADISRQALKVAKENAELNKVEVNFIQSDLFTHSAIRTAQYDIIISNPPYIPTAEVENLQTEISYEPRAALDGGRDGLDFCRRIIKQAPDYLKERGFLILEMGFNQRYAIEDIFRRLGNFEIAEVVKDYNGIDRVIVARKLCNV